MIRHLEPNDSQAYYQIRLEGLRLNPEAFGTGAGDWSKATGEQLRNLLARTNEDDFVLGKFQNGTLAGVVGMKRENKFSVKHKGTVWGLMVLPQFRNQGVGTSLLKQLITTASQNQGLKYIRAIVTMSEVNAKPLFEACGFTTYGVERDGIKNSSQFFDQAFMALNLRGQ